MPRKAQHPSIQEVKKHVRQLNKRVQTNAKQLQNIQTQLDDWKTSLRQQKENKRVRRRPKGRGNDVYTPMSKDALARQDDIIHKRGKMLARHVQRYEDATDELHGIVADYFVQIEEL